MGVKKEHIVNDFRHEVYYYRLSIFQLFRPLTLTGTITPLLVGTGIAAQTVNIKIDLFIALLVAALLIQMTTNVLNDYFDFKNGQDQEKWGLSNEIKSTMSPAYYMLPIYAIILIALAVILGTWLAVQSTLWIIPIGVFGIYAGIQYSAGSRSFSSIGLGEVVAAFFLGPIIMLLSYVVQGVPVDIQIITISIPFSMLIATMILTNNIRDLKKDRMFRKTIAIRLGRTNAVKLLTFMLILTYVFTIFMIIIKLIPSSALLVLLALPLAIKLRLAFRTGAKRQDEIKGMKWAALHHWVFGLLFAIGVWINLL